MFLPLLHGRILFTVSAIAALSALPAHAGGVWVVQGQGSGHYATIQAAVDAAATAGSWSPDRGPTRPS
jgi:pectin methylesterase-like acyl-CoA thioesterase